jgi:hypothetical protein
MNIRNNYLSHHGIDGQRKGINRYQLPDGTWTEEGLKRRRDREGRTAKYADTMSKSVRNAFQSMDNTYSSWNRISDNPDRYREQINSMSDDELRKYINRLVLENQYTNLRAGREDYKQRRGKEIASAILTTAGGTAVTAASTIGIITAIRGMRLDKALK